MAHNGRRTMELKNIGKLSLAAVLTLAVPVASASAQDDALPAGFETQSLMKTTVTRENEPITYPTGAPEIISVIGTLQKGGRTALHEHPVPVYVYVIEGEVEIKTEGGEPHRYKAGEAFIEAQNRKHQAFNAGDIAAKLLVVFVGEQGKPTTVADN
jgi:quercetin dioxygenase-like cupin family protein